MTPDDTMDVVAAVIRRGGEILICQRPKDSTLGGQWEFPGGKVEDGETPEHALIRELKEELDVKAKVGKLLMEHTHTYAPDRCAHLLFYETEIVSGQIQLNDHQEVRWVKPIALRLFPFVAGDAPLIEKLARGEI